MAFKGRVLLTYASKQFNPNNDRTRWQTAYNACLAAQKELSENGNVLYILFIRRYGQKRLPLRL